MWRSQVHIWKVFLLKAWSEQEYWSLNNQKRKVVCHYEPNCTFINLVASMANYNALSTLIINPFTFLRLCIWIGWMLVGNTSNLVYMLLCFPKCQVSGLFGFYYLFFSICFLKQYFCFFIYIRIYLFYFFDKGFQVWLYYKNTFRGNCWDSQNEFESNEDAKTVSLLAVSDHHTSSFSEVAIRRIQ